MFKKIFIILLIYINFLLTAQNLSNGYKDIKLGMSKSEVEDLLKKSPDFIPLKEEVLSIRIEPDTEIITVEGANFIEIAYFHFNNDKLFQIFLKINEKKIGYYLLLKKFTDKFGKPAKLEPKRAFWENQDIRIVIEKPCSLKYIYLPIWNTLLKKEDKLKNYIQEGRDSFLDQL